MATAHKMAATQRRRLLPAWMGAAGEGERRVGVPGRVGRRRQKAAAEPRAVTVYCMNEAELVDVALGVLAESLQREGAEKKACSRSREEQDLQQMEQELQAAPSQALGGTASVEEGSDCSPGPLSPPGAGVDAERTGLEDSEDDALKYVREIFFT